MAEIRVFHTHIEVYPYEKGDCPQIEKMQSKYNRSTHKYEPIGFFIQNDILYLPRGISSVILEKYFHNTPTLVTKYDDYSRIKKGTPKYGPKSNIQKNAINFLAGEEDFAYSKRFSQLGLNLDQGDGKTYSAVCAILKMKLKAIIIVTQTKIKEQWKKTFESMTTFPMENSCDITGTDVMEKIMKGEINKEIYFVNHQTITSYARNHGWTAVRDFFKKIKVGIKVIDETHKFYYNIIMIDSFSNCYKTFYLTATFTRSDPSEIAIYKRSFSSLARFGEETTNSDEKRKHIIFVAVFYKSKPSFGVEPHVKTVHGFSDYMFIDYSLSEPNNSLRKVIYNILEETKQLSGKTLVLSPKTETVEILAEDIRERTGRDVGTIHSKNGKAKNKENEEKEIISSTLKSLGEGADIKGLRVLINTTPIGSKAIADQARGRLREYSPDDDTFFFQLVDMAVPESHEMLKRIMPVMSKKCKQIKMITMDV